MAETPKSGETGATKPAPDQHAEDELMKIRKAAGAIAEVIEPVQRTVMQRTDR